MAKKDKKKVPMTSIPMTIAGLSGGEDLSEITKSVNSGILDKKVTKPENTTDHQSSLKLGGRPKKSSEAIVDAVGNTEWDLFMDYTSQFYTKNFQSYAVYIDNDIKKFFLSMKLVLGPNTDLKSMVNAALRLFADKYRNEINDRIRQEFMNE